MTSRDSDITISESGSEEKNSLYQKSSNESATFYLKKSKALDLGPLNQIY
jgi:hypothetical protein